MLDFYSSEEKTLYHAALALIFVVDHQPLDDDARAVADLARRKVLKVRKRLQAKGALK